MSDFTLNILGCGSAVPTPLHNPSSQVIDYRGKLMMIDCGEGAQSMMRRMHLPFSRLSRIFISHLHGDHCLGLPGLLSTLSLHEKTGTVVIHLPADGVDIMKRITDYFCRESTYEIIFEPIPDDGGIIYETSSLIVKAFPLYHRVPCFGFQFSEKPKQRHLKGDMAKFYSLPISAINAVKNGEDYITPDGTVVPNEHLTTPPDPSRSYAYCSDTAFDTRVAEAVKGTHVIYHEATYDSSLADDARQRGHSTAAEAGQIAALAQAEMLVIGHYSKRYTNVDILVDDARTQFPNVIAAQEGLTIDII
ncbi:MAG: ribonuclease Z [Paramuribaculum sp.]|nr:ribonuclease Z [Paramuribaculum sp.]